MVADTSSKQSNSRKSPRKAVKVTAELFVSEGRRFKVVVLDLSSSGFRIETANHIPLERKVYLTLPGFQTLPARVAWNDNEHYGCEFSQPLHDSIFVHLSSRFPMVVR